MGQGSGSTQVVATSSEETSSSGQKPISWNELMKKISQDERFKSHNGEPKLGMVEDELTLFSLSKLSNSSSSSEELFKKETKTSEDDFYNQYMQINKSGINKDILGDRPLFFSPDSVVLSEALSSRKLEGIFFYNGDALYAHQMLEEGEEESDSSDSDSSDEDKEIHVAPLSPALWFLDSIVISSKSSPAKEERIYKFLEKLSFENFDKLSSLDRQKELEDEEVEEKENRPEWLLDNFKEIGYTPTLKEFNKWIKGGKSS
ncbi:hypothetical protein OVS_00840 [Mycoplasma ovis str. Michigan]|uniref:Uncharacterized protein n=1 Tax=Mycoplasma ovis str. Michigan TaxID=1415773 RepID=A0ABM5P110_9MOLU|nr:hypothetical protein [Mycoplasma ovis]AHC40156.1 hypothetical protein OVS_00840 [Mycoplasma ovis str. Michigan]